VHLNATAHGQLCDAIRARQFPPTFEGRVDGLDGAANAVSSTPGVMLANPSIQNTTTPQGLPHCAFRRLAGSSERFVVSARLESPLSRG
jgi:hypothetical protein